MEISALAVVISILAAISGVILGWTGKAKAVREDIKKEAGSDALLKADVEYIKRGVDDMRLEARVQRQSIDALSERVTRLEESTKQAHHRLNRIEKNGGE
jgi:uncharacterized membrane protein